MPEAVDGDQRQVLFGLPQVLQRVGKLQSVRRQELDTLCGANTQTKPSHGRHRAGRRLSGSGKHSGDRTA